MLVFIIVPMVLPYCFNFIMNYHYREALGLSLEAAVLFSGIAVLFSAGISEIPSMMFIHRIIEKIGPKNVVIIGLLASIIRWTIASVAHSPLIFATTFLFHGICFTFTYIGFTTIVKNRLGNDAISKVMTLMSLFIAITAAIMSQVFNYFIQYYDTFAILKSFVVISIICAVAFVIVANKSKLNTY